MDEESHVLFRSMKLAAKPMREICLRLDSCPSGSTRAQARS